MHLIFILKHYISRHVNYLRVMSHHYHLHPLLPAQLQEQPIAPPTRSLVNVTILCQLQQPSIDDSIPFLRPTTGKLCV